MKKIKLFLKSIGYSVKLIHDSSRFMVIIYFLLNIVGCTLALFGTFSIKYIFDCVTVENPRIDVIMLWVGLYLLSLVISQTNTLIQNIIYDSIFKKAEHQYDCILLNKLAALPLSVVDSSEGKDMIADVRYAKNTVVYTSYRVIRIISLMYTFIVGFITLCNFNIWFSLLFLMLSIPGIILRETFDKKAENLRRERAPDVRKICYYRWMLTDISPAKDVRMYDLTHSVMLRYNEEKKRYLWANKKLSKQKLALLLFADIIRRSGEILFTIFVVSQAINKKISIGDVALYIGLSLTVSNAFSSIALNLVMGYTRTTEIMSRVFKFLAIKTENKIAIRKIKKFESLAFKDVYFKYPHSDKYILEGASFTLNRGDKLSIVGINGAGKSTLIKLMLGLYEIESGHILINGYPMSDYDICEVRSLFSVLFQNYVQYPLSLRENVALSSVDRLANDAEIEAALRQSGIYKTLQLQLENGFDSNMTRKFDDRGIALSKGQWQKIALSRAYFKNADIIIFDEPSAALDAEAEDKIFNDFASISNGRTGIMISHRISAARMSNKVIVLDSGKIIESGTHDELITLGGLYAKLYNLQREKYTMKEG